MKIVETKKTEENITLVVDIDQQEWKKEQKKITNSIIANIKIDGYRKGKVPYEVAMKRIDPQDIISRSIGKILNETAKSITETNEFKEIEEEILDIPPSVNILKASADEVQFEFNYVSYPEVTVDGYKDIKIDVKEKEITDKDVENEIDQLLSSKTMLSPKEKGSIVEGDVVTFDFKGFVAGKEFEGGSAKNYELKIGSKQFIPGFESQMIGMNIGDKKDVNVTFPKDYHKEDLAGKPARFEVIVNSISTITKPNLDDELVKSLNMKDIDTVDKLKTFIKDRLTKNASQQFEDEKKKEVYSAIAKVVKVSKIPSQLVEKEKEKLIRNVESQIKMYNVSLDKYLEIIKVSKENFEKQQFELAEQNLKISMGILKICELEKIESTEEELQVELDNATKIYGMSKEEILKNINNDLTIFESFVIEKKIINFFINK